MSDLNIEAISATDKNFCRVFEIPSEYPSGYLHGGGKPVEFQMVDWFNPIPPPGIGPQFESWDDCKTGLIEFLQQKRYVKAGRKYLVLTGFGESFVFENHT